MFNKHKKEIAHSKNTQEKLRSHLTLNNNAKNLKHISKSTCPREHNSVGRTCIVMNSSRMKHIGVKN